MHHFIARRGANDLVPRQAKQPRCGSGHAGVIFNVQNRNSSARGVTRIQAGSLGGENRSRRN
jgi:hypothetical protein